MISSLYSLWQQQQTSGDRSLVWLDMPKEEAHLILEPLIKHVEHLWIGDAHPGDQHCVPIAKTASVLGSEHPLIIYDAYAGLNPDAIGAIAGTLKQSGLLILVTPPRAQWPQYPDPELVRLAGYPDLDRHCESPFIRRMCALLAQSPSVISISTSKQAITPVTPLMRQDADFNEQCALVKQITRLVDGPKNRPLVITADRGRGKSAALGLAAANLLQQGRYNVLLTAPAMAATHSVFAHAAEDPQQITRGRIETNGKALFFMPWDQILKDKPAAELLMVDEAAAIPVSILLKLLKCYPRVVFASTTHGYEGHGRGFSLRFTQALNQHYSGWTLAQLSHPIRWQKDDTLEPLIFKLLLLDSEPASPASGNTEFEHCHAKALSESRLRQVFGLLVNAHYQTSPSDLRGMLDNPDASVLLAIQNKQVVGAVLLHREGQMDQALLTPIMNGKRRPRGHVLPQQLALWNQDVQLLTKRYWRIVRIAVTPEMQRHKIGARLLHETSRLAREAGIDFVGASFAATPDLIPFWLGAGFSAVQLGVSKNPVSGTHGVIVLKATMEDALETQSILRQGFLTRFQGMLADYYQKVAPAIIQQLLADGEKSALCDKNEVLSRFSQGEVPLEVAYVQLKQALLQFLVAQRQYHCSTDIELLIARLLQQRSNRALIEDFDLTGKKALKQALQSAAEVLLK